MYGCEFLPNISLLGRVICCRGKNLKFSIQSLFFYFSIILGIIYDDTCTFMLFIVVLGIIRDDTCQYKSESQAYFCTGYNYEQIVIENMDADTESRRLSPVGVLGWNDNGDGFMDLINGPQDHGWCSGYTCQKRLSTFTSVMATGTILYIDFC